MVLATGHENVIAARSLPEAQAIGREKLRQLTDKNSDFKHVSDETRLLGGSGLRSGRPRLATDTIEGAVEVRNCRPGPFDRSTRARQSG